MRNGSLTWIGFLLRLVFAWGLVFATYNPAGYSYFHWLQASFGQPQASGLLGANALKFVAGVLLLTGWVVYINATATSLGLLGITLILALCGGVIWLFAEMQLFDPGNIQLIVYLTEFVVGIVLAMGMSWSHISRRLSGQIDVDDDD